MRLSIGGWAGAGIDELPYIAFELEANGFDDAVESAQRLVAEALRTQGIDPRRLEVVWAVPVRDRTLWGHLFLEQAKGLFDAEQYELALVAAQMHFEAQVLLVMERAADRIGTAWAARLLKHLGVATLSTDVSCATAELLLEIEVTQSRYWPAYQAHRKRRNTATHQAQPMSKQDARASIEVVQAFWGELAKAERSKTLL